MLVGTLTALTNHLKSNDASNSWCSKAQSSNNSSSSWLLRTAKPLDIILWSDSRGFVSKKPNYRGILEVGLQNFRGGFMEFPTWIYGFACRWRLEVWDGTIQTLEAALVVVVTQGFRAPPLQPYNAWSSQKGRFGYNDRNGERNLCRAQMSSPQIFLPSQRDMDE